MGKPVGHLLDLDDGCGWAQLKVGGATHGLLGEHSSKALPSDSCTLIFGTMDYM